MLLRRAIGLLGILVFALAAPGETAPRRYAYLARYQYTGTSGKMTIQLPTAATGKVVRLIDVFVSCPTAACDVVFTLGGTLATSTSATTYRMRTESPSTSTGLAFTASNSTGGTAMPAVPLAAGFSSTLSGEDFEIRTGEAISITVTSGSQTVTIMPKWEEFDG